MSGESAAHARLVALLADAVRERHSGSGSLCIFADHRSFGTNRPLSINGFYPDVYASDVPATYRIVGEAKTAADLPSDRTLLQLSAFYHHLCLYEHSVLYLAVPWHCVARGRRMLRQIVQVQGWPVVTNVLGF